MTYADLAGTWTGSNGFRLMPSDPLAEAPAAAALTPAAGGNLLVVAYTWRHPDDGPQDGLLVVSPADAPDALTAMWGDSWHQHPAAMVLAGLRQPDAELRFSGEYAGGWGWRILLAAPEQGRLQLRMENVVPAEHATTELPAGGYPVMIMDLSRA